MTIGPPMTRCWAFRASSQRTSPNSIAANGAMMRATLPGPRTCVDASATGTVVSRTNRRLVIFERGGMGVIYA